MIPPEPGPDPPAPTVPEYTYLSSSSISLGAVTGTLYRGIQQNGSDCQLLTKDEDNRTKTYNDIILYDDVLGDPQCYFVRGSSPIIGILGSNSDLDTTCNIYTIVNGNITLYGTEYVDSSVPSDYYLNIKTRNFTLTQRS